MGLTSSLAGLVARILSWAGRPALGDRRGSGCLEGSGRSSGRCTGAPGAELLPGHLEQHYGIRVTQVTRLDGGVAKVTHDGGPPWVARIYLVQLYWMARTEGDAEVLRFLERHGFPAERCAHPEPVSVAIRN